MGRILLFFFIGLVQLDYGYATLTVGTINWDVPVHRDAGYVIIAAGIAFIGLGIRDIVKGRWRKPPPPGEEELKASKVWLNAEYERERLRNPKKYDTEEARQAKAAVDRVLGGGPEEDNTPKP